MKKLPIFKFIARGVAILLIVASLILSVSANGNPSAADNDLQGTVRYVSVTEYDYTTHTESTYQISYTDYEFNSIDNESEAYRIQRSQISLYGIINDGNNEHQWYSVPTYEYNIYPYSAVCSLLAGDRTTAFIVGKRLAMTCAHCVYGTNWYPSAYLMPHAPGNAVDSFIINNGTKVLKAIIPTAYKTNSTIDNDWAILIVEDDIGTANGTLPLNFTPQVNGNPVYVVGYPRTGVNGLTNYMHRSPGDITGVSTFKYNYDCDTNVGNSGSPVIWETYANGVTKYNIVAVHCGAESTYNAGHRIDQFLVQVVRQLNATYQ